MLVCAETISSRDVCATHRLSRSSTGYANSALLLLTLNLLRLILDCYIRVKFWLSHGWFIYATVLASLDFIVLIYANVLTNPVSLPIIFKSFEKSSSPKDAALYITVWTVITINLWHFWGRDRARKIMSKNLAKTAPKNQSKTNKKAQKPQKPRPPVSPVDSIEVELNEMSADFGMTLMKPVRKTPNPDETKWYVFRGGESEVPYTRNQLWLARRITAGSKVRRENETEWTIAGKIPELKDFLKPQK